MTDLLVQYGQSAFVGRFAWSGTPLPRGSAVAIRSPRGLEMGTVLGVGGSHLGVDGDVLREATEADHSAQAKAVELGQQLLTAAEEFEHSVTLLDCEVTLDARAGILHVVPWQACELDPMLAALSERFGLAVRVQDVSRTPTLTDPPEPKASCGDGGCGTGTSGGCGTGGGCSTGSCSRGSVKSAGDLTAYFADLREKMESAGRTPLN